MSAGSESDLTKRNSEVFETHTSTVKSLSFAWDKPCINVWFT